MKCTVIYYFSLIVASNMLYYTMYKGTSLGNKRASTSLSNNITVMSSFALFSNALLM